MRLSTILLLTGMLTASASVYSQQKKFSFNLENVSIRTLFQEIEKQSDFSFLYNDGFEDLDRSISIDVKEQKVEDIMDRIFEDTQLAYRVLENNLIVLAPKKSLQEVNITGSVVDFATGEPLIGVNVQVEGTTIGAVTDVDGKFAIRVTDKNQVLIFSYVGYVTERVSLSGQQVLSIKLVADIEKLDEVVVVGYGTKRKVDLTGSVASVSSGDIVKISSVSTAQAIQGRMSGVQITQNNGEPGSSSTIKIRGIGSLKSDNNPLVLVDGYAGSIDNVDADDIESISVLKDASSAAIYGARAANGVILVTTKRGKEGKISVDFKAEYGFSELTKMPKFLNAREFATKVNEEKVWTGSQLIWTGDYAPEKLQGGTDWFDVIYNTGSLQDYHLGLNGGTEKTKYALSFGYLNQDGVVDNTNYQKGNFRLNFDHKFNKWLKVGTNVSLLRSQNYSGNENMGDDKNTYNGYGLGIAAVRSSPTVPVYFENGSKGVYLNKKPGEYPLNGTMPPHWYMGIRDNNRTFNETTVSTFAEISLIEGLNFKSVVNAFNGQTSVSNWIDQWEAYSPDYQTPIQSNPINGLYNQSDNSYGWELQELLTYDKVIEKHKISILAGFSAEKSFGDNSSLTKHYFPNNELHVMNAGSTVFSSNGSGSETAYTSLFGRINYDFGSRYLISATIRRDGSSAFAPGNQFGVFPSISGAWRISEESFMKTQNIITNLKLRAGYGQLGNAKIPAYSWISSYFLNDAFPFGGSPQVANPAYYITNMTNEDVKWETTTTLDIGIDLGFLRNRLELEIDYYDKSTTDLLMNATVPQTAGNINGPIINIGEVRNAGWEITAKWDDRVGDFSYGVSANISHNKNEVVDMGGIKPLINGNVATKEGYPVNSYWGYKINGIWRTWDELKNNPHRSGDIRPGDYRFLDISGPDGVPDGKINSDDQTYLGDPNPDYYYGFSGFAAWKGFDISLHINGEYGKETMIESVYGGGYIPGFSSFQYYFKNRAILDPVTKEVVSGSTNASGANPGNGSEATVFNISYLRVKNIQLGYTLPSTYADKLKISSIRIYANATNPFLFTDYFGWDQESSAITGSSKSSGGNNYVPVQKTLSFGISLKF